MRERICLIDWSMSWKDPQTVTVYDREGSALRAVVSKTVERGDDLVGWAARLCLEYGATPLCDTTGVGAHVLAQVLEKIA